MSGADPSVVRALFELALSAGADQRAKLLADARPQNQEACDEVEALLKHHERTNALLDAPAVAGLGGSMTGAGSLSGGVRPSGDSARPARIGSYEIIGVLGEGGMGVVYEARQETPRRQVALKVVRPELVTSSMMRRFAHEAEVLGLLQHPGVAQVFEAGSEVDDKGHRRTFIAMELIRGATIIEHAQARSLSVRHRLDLVAQVADAVDHAHRRGVVHRDLKPANIVVDDTGRARVLDFGVARLTQSGPDSATMHTAAGQIIGTLAYMSPEQAAGDPRSIDSRADVYALGAILYELLAGSPPLPVTQMTIAEATAAIRTREPTLLSTVNASLRGDVESIVAKALEKDPGDRYQSAAEMAADLRRHLADEPVLAHPQTTWYQARKFARRNRALVGAVTAAFIALAAGAAIAISQALAADRARDKAETAGVKLQEQLTETERLTVKERTERERAEREAATARGVTNFLVEVLNQGHPEFAQKADLTLLEATQRSGELIDKRFADDPAIAFAMHQITGSVFGAQGDSARFEAHYKRSLELARQPGVVSPRSRAGTAAQYINALSNNDKAAEAEVVAKEELAFAENALPAADDELAGLRLRYGDILAHTGREKEAEPYLVAALKGREETLGKSDRATNVAVNQLALLYAGMGRNEEALPLQRRNLASCIANFGQDHPDVNAARTNLASVLTNLKQHDEAVTLALAAIDSTRRILGQDHPDTLAIAELGGRVLSAAGRFPEAIELLKDTNERLKGLSPRNLFREARGLNALAFVQDRAGDFPGSATTRRAVVAIMRERAVDDQYYLLSEQSLANSLLKTGAHADAVEHYQAALALKEFERSSPSNRARVLAMLASALSLAGKLADADARFDEGWAIVEASKTHATPVGRDLAKLRAEHCTRTGRDGEAAYWTAQQNREGE